MKKEEFETKLQEKITALKAEHPKWEEHQIRAEAMKQMHEETKHQPLEERGKLIMERRNALKVKHPKWYELKLRVEATKQLFDEKLIDRI